MERETMLIRKVFARVGSMSTRPQVHHPVFARVYERLSAGAEKHGEGDHRSELLRGLSGKVLEVGAGNGLNFRHYPSTVTKVIALEPEAYLRAAAERAASTALVPVEVIDAVAEDIPADDESFDGAVISLVLCSLPEPEAALAEVRRVLKPEGELRFYEHVRAESPVVARVQRVMDKTIWPRLSGGCHAGRDSAAAIARAGFSIQSCKRFLFPACALVPLSPHVLGTARKL
jgi:ubiquinone/menaquinone biosynthesis C-methylase UbiE